MEHESGCHAAAARVHEMTRQCGASDDTWHAPCNGSQSNGALDGKGNTSGVLTCSACGAGTGTRR